MFTAHITTCDIPPNYFVYIFSRDSLSNIFFL